MQQPVEAAVSRVADQSVQVHCAGRTDTGVHASGQVVHFDTTSERTKRGWLLGINSHLPEDVNACWCHPVSDDFHARHSATARHYRYRILNRLHRSSLHRHRAWWLHRPLDAQCMHDAAQQLLGEHDFSAFRAAGCQARTAKRQLTVIAVRRNGDWVTLTVSGNAFLQHMVRNICGSLVAIGEGDKPPAWLGEVLRRKDRKAAGVTAPPQGLTLTGVSYPAGCGLPVPVDDEWS